MMKRFLVSVVICAGIFGAGYVVTKVFYTARMARAAANAAKQTEQQAKPVRVQMVTPCGLDDRLLLTGMVEPWEDILISAEATGKIERQDVKEGDFVKAGTEVVHVDTSLIQAQMEQVAAQEKLAMQELQRAQSMSTKGIATGQAMDKAQADRDMAVANMKMIQIRLEKSVAKSPADGIIDTLYKDLDEFVDMGAPLFRLVQVQKLKVNVGIPEREIVCFAKGNGATVTLDALQGKSFEGTIHEIAPTADPRTLTFKTEVAMDNADGVVKPGMIARVALVRKRYENAVSIPLFCVMPLENQRYVFVESDGQAHMRQIETGVIQGNEVQVTSGLSAGDRLIVSGQRELQDGDRVQVLETVGQ